jgi:glycosyltransferase involved in cell wall biosynthesis
LNTLALCIPAYNAELYLPGLLESAMTQSVPFDEILVYDDSSSDDTIRVAQQYGARVISGAVNQGCSFGKNTLAGSTQCDWIHFHDADDLLLPDFTRLVHRWISRSGDRFDVLLLNFDYIDFNTKTHLGSADHNAAELHADPLRYAILHKIVNFGVYKRTSFEAAGGFDLDENVLFNEDNAFHQRLAKKALKFDYLPEITCINYRYKNSMSASNHLKCARANYHVLEKTASTHGDLYPRELAQQLWLCMASLSVSQDWAYVKRALLLSKRLGYAFAPEGSTPFMKLSKAAPFFSLWFREKMIRLFKPQLRR